MRARACAGGGRRAADLPSGGGSYWGLMRLASAIQSSMDGWERERKSEREREIEIDR